MSYFSKEKQNRFFPKWLVIFIVLELLSGLAWRFNDLNWVVLLIIALVSLFFLFKKPIYSLYIPLAEIFWGSLGHSFDYNIINTRLLIFILVVLVFVITNIRQLNKLKLFKDKALGRVYLFLLFFILVTVVSGYYNSYNLKKVFFDANAYFYLLYLPIWYEVYDKKYLKNVFDILKAAVLVIAVKTLVLLNIFSQGYEFIDTDSIYKWVRDTRTGEITPFKDSFFRIFMQSQFYLILAWFWLFLKQMKDFKNKNSFLLLAIISAALMISLSRSFWLGAFIGLLFIVINIFIYQKKRISFHIFLSLGAVAVAGILLVQVFYNLPIYKNINIFTQRTTSVAEPAANTRSQLWGPMWQTIAERPVIGHGFGKEISFKSSDPRIKNVDNPEGWTTTYAFEWGWMDQLVKGGGILVLLFVIWIMQLYYRAYVRITTDPVLSLVLTATLTSLLIIHIFTPYINHPLGLAFLMLVSIIFGSYAKKTNSYY
ncbi:MAG: O-antigen ligase family protein [Candidatus Komeilibacteria bacterium]|jgi:O-antigen ligase|nr:O-antigen ligase family protein [Candidatus Komeilibacteria bacterium]MBT4447643.1 O-antigen ligase family protein [Candidatus Komeilibacteria bacterium]